MTTKKKRRGSGKVPGPAVHDDLVLRKFVAPAPDALWLTDITEHPTTAGIQATEGKLYSCRLKDLFSNRIVLLRHRAVHDSRARYLRTAPGHRPTTAGGDGDCPLGQGGQFRARSFQALLKASGLTGSMDRVAAAGDNAPKESFHSLLLKNVLNRRRWGTRSELHYAIVTWFEHTYNRRRRQRALGRLTPVEFELAFARPGVAA